MTDKFFTPLTRRFFLFSLAACSLLLRVILSSAMKKAHAMTKQTGKNRGRHLRKTSRAKKRCALSVAVEPCATYDPETVYRSLVTALGKIGYAPVSGASVLLKPNIIAQNTPEQATTTHPA